MAGQNRSLKISCVVPLMFVQDNATIIEIEFDATLQAL